MNLAKVGILELTLFLDEIDMDHPISKLLIPAINVIVINFALGFLTPVFAAKSIGFWCYFAWLHMLTFLLIGWLGNILGIGGIRSKLKFKSEINKEQCLLLWRMTFFTAIVFVTAWITILSPHLIKLLSKEIVPGIFLSLLYLLLVLGGAILVTYVSLPKLWGSGIVFWLYFKRVKVIAILSTITFMGFGMGYYFGNGSL